MRSLGWDGSDDLLWSGLLQRSVVNEQPERGGPNGWGGRLDKKHFSDIAPFVKDRKLTLHISGEKTRCLNLNLLVKSHVCKPKLLS